MNPGDSGGSGAAFDNEQTALGGIAGFPYSDQTQAQSVGSVAGQVFGPNASTAVAVAALEEALAQNSGSIDIIAYSGGAQAFTTAFGELTAAQQARIGNILYISPGAGEQLAGTGNNTTVVLGTGGADVAATSFMTIPFGANQIRSNCSHTDLACLFQAAQAQLTQFAKDGPCKNQDVFTRPPPPIPPKRFPLYYMPAVDDGGGGYGGLDYLDLMFGGTPVVTSTISYN